MNVTQDGEPVTTGRFVQISHNRPVRPIYGACEVLAPDPTGDEFFSIWVLSYSCY